MELRYPLTRYVYRPISIPAATALARTRITPTQVTYVSGALSFGGGVAFAFRLYILGAVLTLLGSITDCIDGDLARASGRTSASGGYLDHVLDRWTDAALVLGLMFSDLDTFAAAGAFALLGSFMTSYSRTKGQVEGVDVQVGIGGRDARMLILVVAGLTGYIEVGLWAVAGLGLFTAVHRMTWVIRKLNGTPEEAEVAIPTA